MTKDTYYYLITHPLSHEEEVNVSIYFEMTTIGIY